MTYQILNNEILIKTITAKGMASIYNQFNTYAKQRKSTPESMTGVIGCMVWVLPNGDVLSLAAV